MEFKAHRKKKSAAENGRLDFFVVSLETQTTEPLERKQTRHTAITFNLSMTSNNRFLILTSVVLSIVLFFFLQDEATLQAKLTPSSSNNNMEKSLRFTILHTSDLHSQFQGVGPDTIYHEARGHFARLKYAITSLQNKLNPFATLTVDAGDWNSGTLFHLMLSVARSALGIVP